MRTWRHQRIRSSHVKGRRCCEAPPASPKETNGESIFVRHGYFTGADEPYEKLKRALWADIDEAAWSSLYSTMSRPFDKPKTGKIAIMKGS